MSSSDFSDVALGILSLVLALGLIVFAGIHVEEFLVRRNLRHRRQLREREDEIGGAP
jgi:hypothetical protein